MKIYVGGVNGSGKSTVLEIVSEGSGYSVVHATGEFMHYLGFGNDYDKLRELPNTLRDEKLAQFMQRLLQRKDSFLLDSHYLNLVRGYTSRVVGDWIKGFDAIVLISAPLESLWQRVIGDASWRDRALFPEGVKEPAAKKLLANYQKETKEEFQILARKFNLPFIEIVNKDQKVREASIKLVDFILKLATPSPPQTGNSRSPASKRF